MGMWEVSDGGEDKAGENWDLDGFIFSICLRKECSRGKKLPRYIPIGTPPCSSGGVHDALHRKDDTASFSVASPKSQAMGFILVRAKGEGLLHSGGITTDQARLDS
jgi:hypothetical protein